MADIAPADKFDRLPERYRQRARQIAERVREIEAICVPAPANAIGDALKRMRAHLRPQPDTEVKDMAAGFREACRDLPEWAVSEAANDFLGGRVPNHTGQYMPTCAEFAKRAREILVPFLSERAALKTEAGKLIERAEDEARRLAIEAERQDPSVRERVAAMLADATKGGTKRVSFQPEALSEEKQKRIDALKKPRQFESRLAETRIVKRAAK